MSQRMNRTALFINPRVDIRERYGSRTNIRAGFLPPLGLAYLAGTLIPRGAHVRIIDLSVEDLSDQQLCDYVSAEKPDIIGFTAMSVGINKALQLAEAIKRSYDCPIVFGGVHVTNLPEETLKRNPAVDIIVIGEGERAIDELFDWLDGTKQLSKIKGIAYRDHSGKVVLTPPRDPINDLDSLPFPPRHLFNNELYIPLPNQYKNLPVMSIVGSRGCPYGKCTFCALGGVLRQRFRLRSPENVLEEIGQLVDRWGIREVSFWDDDFTASPKWAFEVSELLAKSKLNLTWNCFARVSNVTPELLKAMSAAGCYSIFYGLESGVQELLDNIQKGTTVEQNRLAVEWANDAGIQVRGSFMLGLPGETPELGKKTVEFALSLDLYSLAFCITTPIPGSRMFEEYVREGMVFEDFSKFNVFEPAVLPKGYQSIEQIHKLRRIGYRRFYLRPKYILKLLRHNSSLSDLRKLLWGLKFVYGISK